MNRETLIVMGYCFLIFMSGLVFAANLSQLIPTNPMYTVGWHKVIMSIILGVTFTVSIVNRKRNA